MGNIFFPGFEYFSFNSLSILIIAALKSFLLNLTNDSAYGLFVLTVFLPEYRSHFPVSLHIL